jgi:beta-lactamase regulating signal transducer with metallopeptidase domain
MTLLENIMSGEIVWQLGWTLLHFVWQAAALALLLAIILQFLRQSTASLRYGAACLILLLMAVLPVATLCAISVASDSQTPLTPGPEAIALPVAAPLPISMPLTTLESDLHISWQQRLSQLTESALPYLVFAWLLGVAMLSLRHVGAWICLQRLRQKQLSPVSASLEQVLHTLAQRLKVSRPVQLMESARVQIPTVIGWMRPIILLPATALTGLTSSQIEVLLAHELAHIRRCDYLSNMLQIAVETLGFYHPAVWWVSRTIRSERENCCDDLAVAVCGDPKGYAQALAEMEDIRCHQVEMALAASGGNLLKRVSRLLGKDMPQGAQRYRMHAVVAVVLLFAMAIPTALAFSRAHEDDTVPTVVSSSEQTVADSLPIRVKTDEKLGQIRMECVIYEAPADFKLPYQKGTGNEPQIYIESSKKGGRQGLTAKALKNREVKICASPTVICNDGKPGNIEVVEEIPYNTGIAASAPSSEQSAPMNTTKFLPKGIQLEITPKIVSNNAVNVCVDLTQSDVVFSSDSAPSESIPQIPVVRKSVCSTQLTMESDHTLVIGGLSNTQGFDRQIIFLITPRIMPPSQASAEDVPATETETVPLDAVRAHVQAQPPRPVSTLDTTEPVSLPTVTVTPADQLPRVDTIRPDREDRPSDHLGLDPSVPVLDSNVSSRKHTAVFALKHAESKYVAALLGQLLNRGNIKIVADERTNSVLATANFADIKQVERLIIIIEQAAIKPRTARTSSVTNTTPRTGTSRPSTTAPARQVPLNTPRTRRQTSASVQRTPGLDNLGWRREMKRQRIMNLQSELFSAESSRIQLESDIRLREQSTPSGMSLQEVLRLRQDYVNSDPTITALAEKITQMEMDAILAHQDLAENNPDIKQQVQLLADLKKRLSEQKREITGALNDMMSAEAQQSHGRQLATLRQQLEQSQIYQDRLRKMLAVAEKELAELEAELAAAEQKRRTALKTQNKLTPPGQR